MEFQHLNFGRCTIIASRNDCVLIELEKNYEKYVVAHSFDLKSFTWFGGNYFKKYDEAMLEFTSIFQEYCELNIEKLGDLELY